MRDQPSTEFRVSAANQAPALPSVYSPDLDAHLWRNLRSVSGQLRCGLLLHSRGTEAWAQQVIDLLLLEPQVAVASAFVLDSRPREPAALLRWLYRWGSSEDSPLRRLEPRLPPQIPIVSLENEAQLRARVVSADLDVLLWLDTRPLYLDCAGLARLGVWYFRCGDPPAASPDPPYWLEVAEQRPVSALALIQDRGESLLRQLALCHVPTQPGLHLHRNAVEPLGLAGAVLIRQVLDTLHPDVPAEAPLIERSPDSPAAGNLKIASFIARQTFATLRIRSRRKEPRWFVAVRNNPALFRSRQSHFQPQEFQDIPSSAGSQFADPFLFQDQHRHWLFVEEIPAGEGKGRLAVMELDSQGIPGTPATILEKPYHLSYPFVIRHRGEIFMIPECSANQTVDLYRAVRFPFEWTLEKTLFSGVRTTDTTPFFLDGTWYFFTTSARLGQETFLFCSDTLDGEWRYHPRNPICSDARRARGAGPLFRAGDDLIRPSQDCSIRYGYAIALNRILEISPRTYREELAEVIPATWRPGLLGTHSLCSNGAFEAIDGLRR